MKVSKRRQRERKTDYLKRLKMLKSNKPRLVVRKTNKYIIVQYIISEEAKDLIKIGATSKQLLKQGWPESAKNSLKSIPASYLTGYLIGKKIINQKLKSPIIDMGMQRTIGKTKLYGFVKGVADSGVDIKIDEKTFPSEERIKGENMKNKVNIEEIKSKIDSK